MENIPLPTKITVKEEKKNESTFIIEPYYPGYGMTIGNALRRILFSSIPGAAVSAVKVKGVDHEFSTIPGVKENMIEIIMNLKNLRIKLFSKEPLRLKIKFSGKGVITAKEFEKKSDVEIVNSDLKIAESTDDKTKLEMEAIIENGRGYVPVEQKKSKDLEVGMITIDSIFSPVLSVGYETENMRVGQKTDYDRLIMKIKTDGIMTPFETLKYAVKILTEQFTALSNPDKLMESAKAPVKTEEKAAIGEVIPPEVSNVSLAELGLSTRTFNALDRAKIRTVGEIAKKSEKELLELSGFGQNALKEIAKILKKYKLELKA